MRSNGSDRKSRHCDADDGRLNFREGWRGHLCERRFASFVLDEPYLLTAARHVELNPVRAELITAGKRHPWSSAAADVRGKGDTLVRVASLFELAPNGRAFLAGAIREADATLLRVQECAGRPPGEEAFLGDARTGPWQDLRTAQTVTQGQAAELSMVSPEPVAHIPKQPLLTAPESGITYQDKSETIDGAIWLANATKH
jgi:hypothetical protein